MAERRPDRARGPNHDIFWDWCARGELRLQACTACGKLIWPVDDACDSCGGTRLDWRALSGEGRILSWCSFHYDYYAGTLPLPYDTILVELAEGPLFISDPEGFGKEDVSFGMAVVLAFRDCEDSQGAFRLPVFTRAG